MSKFFTFNQNNSFGVYTDPAKYVIVEAEDAEKANAVARYLGLDFSGFGDCPCCGNRWSEQYDDSDGTDTPTIYDKPVSEATESSPALRDQAVPFAVIYYLNGSVEIVRNGQPRPPREG